MIGGVGDKLGGESGQLSWHATIRQEAGRDHDMLSYKRIRVRELNLKSAVHGLDIRHRYITHVGHQVLDVPGRVVKERFYRRWDSAANPVYPLRPAVVLKAKARPRAGQVQAVRLRSEVHAGGRVMEPGI